MAVSTKGVSDAGVGTGALFQYAFKGLNATQGETLFFFTAVFASRLLFYPSPTLPSYTRFFGLATTRQFPPSPVRPQIAL